jgi:predicted nucleic acid-binding protein
LIVLDASIKIGWLLNEPGLPTDDFEATIENKRLIVPAHWGSEIGNALLVSLRRGRLNYDQLELAVGEIASLEVDVQQPVRIDGLVSTMQFAEAHRLTFYDAVYVELARDTAATLATLDAAMRRAATAIHVPLFPSEGS